MYVNISIVKETNNKLRVKQSNFNNTYIKESYLTQLCLNSRSFYILDTQTGQKRFLVYTIAPIVNSETIVEKTVHQLRPLFESLEKILSFQDFKHISDHINTL